MNQKVAEFQLTIEHLEGYAAKVTFDKEHYQPLIMDEPAPLSKDQAPNPARVMAAAIGNCLTASLVFCMQKKGVTLKNISSQVTVELVRNEQKRLRIGHINVSLNPVCATQQDIEALQKECLQTFEDFCVVTQSVREGLRVNVDVQPALANV